MSDVFGIRSSGKWMYTAETSTVLATTTVALPERGHGVRFAAGPMLFPRHDAAYWDRVTVGFDFSEADQVPPAQFNRVLWAGLMGNKPFPEIRGKLSAKRDDPTTSFPSWRQSSWPGCCIR
jgi:hypothetical protein